MCLVQSFALFFARVGRCVGHPSHLLFLRCAQDHPFTLTIGPSAILQEVCGGPGQGFAFGVQAMDSTPIILGDVLIQNYHVVFDKYESVIGFRSLAGCPVAP